MNKIYLVTGAADFLGGTVWRKLVQNGEKVRAFVGKEEFMKEKFSYNYSADRDEELRKIREKYEIKTDEEQDKLELIRAMDRKIELTGTIFGILFGLFFTLVFGGGLCLCIKAEGMGFVLGLFLGILGLLGMAFALKITKIFFEKQKEKHGAEILRVIDESMGKK